MATKKTATLRPFGGALDTRSLPDEMIQGGIRWRQNFAMRSNRRVCRRPMFEKLLSADNYNNEDLHDQLLLLQTYYDDLVPKPDGADEVTAWPSVLCDAILQTRSQVREPVTLIYNASGSDGRHTLIVGTSSRLYSYSPFSSNYRLLVDGMGDGESRFKAAIVKDSVMFTNDVDQPFIHNIGQQTMGCARRAITPVPELDEIGLNKAKIVVGWKGIMLLMNVEMDGIRVPNRIVWSGFNKPFEWSPGVDTIAGFQDLGNGEVILNSLVLGDQVIIYTTWGIWQIFATGSGTQPLTFFNAYKNEDGHKCLFYENCIASIGHAHIYASQDAIYLYSTTIPEPERIEWLHLGSDVMYNDINEDECRMPVMGFHPLHKEMWISWPQDNQSLPSRTMVANFDENHLVMDVVDHGFTAFANWQPDNQMTIGEFLLTYGICQIDDLNTQLIKQGCPMEEIEAVCDPEYFWNPDEDLDEPMGENSLCECLDGLKTTDFCEPCDDPPIFTAASSEDNCLKQIGTAFSREICQNPTDTGTTNEDGCYISPAGDYDTDGYYSILRTGPISFGKTDVAKLSTHMLLEAYPADSATPARLRTTYGISYSARDSNTMADKIAPYSTLNTVGDTCGVLWRRQDDYDFECQDVLTPEAMLALNQIPGFGFEWAMLEEGNFHYLEWSLVNGSNFAPTGGDGCFGRVEITWQPRQSCD